MRIAAKRWIGTLATCVFLSQVPGMSVADADGKEKSKVGQSIYDLTMKDIDGKDVSLDVYKGKVCLIVNVASL